MAKKKITTVVEEELANFMKEKGYELFNVEFIKESKDWYLRVYIDKLSGGEYVPVGTDDCELVSRYLSDRLDEIDPIEQNYYLEVSSPGLERALLRDKDFVRFSGETVEVHLYKAMDGRKVLTGILTGLDGDEIVIEDEKKKEIRIPRELASKTKLVVVF